MHEAFHPSEYIAEELEARDWCRADLAIRMAGEADVNLLALDLYFAVAGRPDLAVSVRLGRMADDIGVVFGTGGEFWRNLEASYITAMKLRSN